MVIQWSFDRYRAPRVLMSENPKLKPVAGTEGSDSWLPAARRFFGAQSRKKRSGLFPNFLSKKNKKVLYGIDRIEAQSSKVHPARFQLSAFSFELSAK